MIIAILDGGHAVDDGVAAEVAYFAAHHGHPIVGIRSDFRLVENLRAPVNQALRYMLDTGPYGNHLFHGPNAYADALRQVKEISSELLALTAPSKDSM
jgi:nucleoside 2-deoxyribosyltransferase